MTSEELKNLCEKVFFEIDETLNKKGAEYSTEEDRLVNFYEAATFLGIDPKQALWGFVTKHTIALNDFINRSAKGIAVPREQWLEKIRDKQTYLILLEALLMEEGIV